MHHFWLGVEAGQIETGDVNLTAERRRELLDLLDDHSRLQTEYPPVAEYLEVSPTLTGTGDDAADASFELRFVHFATAGDSVQDPYWEIVKPLIRRREGRGIIAPAGGTRLGYAQTVLQQMYAYAVPSPETIEWVRDAVGQHRLIEVGAGRGYWAARLASVGVSVAAFDSHPPDIKSNVSFPGVGTKIPSTWYEVKHAATLLEASPDNSNTVLLLCWPPGWENAMASDALSQFEESGGQRLVYIGEPLGGKTGNSAFFSALAARWKLESVDSQYARWWNLNDCAQIWVRR